MQGQNGQTSSRPIILVIDDEPQIRRAVRNALAELADRVVEAETGTAGIDAAAAQLPGLIVLDLALPDMAGVSVCRELRKWSRAPILVLSARHSERDKVSLLDAGADDFITKPFSTLELQARVRALLRRAQKEETDRSPVLRLSDLEIDAARRVSSLKSMPRRT
ncbi:MAG: response regulator transcription factor [Longimicrobiales bacterium]